MLPSLAGRRLAITGGSGAIGTRIIRRLLQETVAEVRIVDVRPPAAHPDARVSSSQNSVLDAVALSGALVGCDAVVHLAACTSASDCAADPVACFQTNVCGTVAVLDACRRAAVRHLVLSSTSHVYGMPARLPASERDPVRPASVYACSKAAAEVAALGWSAYGVRATVARLGNVYGPGVSGQTVLDQARRDALGGGAIRVRCFTPVRDFIHIDDVAEAFVRLLAANPPADGVGEVLNVSTGHGYAVGEALQILRDVVIELGLPRSELVEREPGSAEAVPALVLDVNALARRLGWQPSIDLRQGLRSTVREEVAAGRTNR